MREKKKTLVIITGITGAIGNAVLSKYVKMNNTVCYGISRKAKDIIEFLNTYDKKLPDSSIVFSLSKMDNSEIKKFTDSIDFEKFSEVKYIHLLGYYPFEINQNGEYFLENDKDKDGINDTCKFLSYDTLKRMNSNLKSITRLPIKTIVLGSLADKHRPKAQRSQWKILEKVKEYMKEISSKNNKMFILNVSSVICTHEMITRPFVFTQTSANPKYWLGPEEIADKISKILKKSKFRYSEQSIFHKAPNFQEDYYTEKKFNLQKLRELFRR